MVSTRRTGALLAALAVTGAAVLGTAPPASASSHREAPTITTDPVADNTDVYAFVSPENPDTVTLIANYIPLEEPAGGPNFHKFGDDVSYQINVDNNGDAKPDVTYDFRFKTTNNAKDTSFLYNSNQVTALDDPDLNVVQKYNVYEVRNGKGYDKPFIADVPVPPVNIGPRSTPNYADLAKQAVKPLPGGGSVFAGPRDEGFYVDLGSIFDLGGLRPLNQAHLIKQPMAKGEDGTSGYNVHTIALQIPKSRLVRADDPVIGVWATANRQKTGKDGKSRWVQVSRLGNPLVNEVNNPAGKKDRFNATRPVDDRKPLDDKGTTFVDFTLNPELGRLIPVLYPGVTVPPAPRNDLKAVFFTGVPGLNQPKKVVPAEMLRLNTSIMPSDPKASFPNGRKVGDDVVDIELQAIAGVLVDGFDKFPNNALSDGVNGNDVPYLTQFPYLGTPHQGYDHLHDHGTGGS